MGFGTYHTHPLFYKTIEGREFAIKAPKENGNLQPYVSGDFIIKNTRKPGDL